MEASRCPRAVQSCPRPSLAGTCWRAGPASHWLQNLGAQACTSPRQHSGTCPGYRGMSEPAQASNEGELAQSLVCCEVGQEEVMSPPPPLAVGRAGTRVVKNRTGYWSFLPLSSSSTNNHRPCTFPVQHIGADLDGEGTGEPALRVGELESWPCTFTGQHSGAGSWSRSAGETP